MARGRRMSITGSGSGGGGGAPFASIDAKLGKKKVQVSIGTMGLQLFAGGKPLENYLYAKMEGWSEDVVGGSGLRIELIGEKPVVLKTDSADTVKVVLEKMTEHATALASQLRMPEASPTAVTTSKAETTGAELRGSSDASAEAAGSAGSAAAAAVVVEREATGSAAGGRDRKSGGGADQGGAV